MADEAVNVAYEDISHVQQEVEIEIDDNNSFVVGDCFESFAKLEATGAYRGEFLRFQETPFDSTIVSKTNYLNKHSYQYHLARDCKYNVLPFRILHA